MTDKELEKWDSSRLKYWLDTIMNVALVWCGVMLLAFMLSVDLEVLF